MRRPSSFLVTRLVAAATVLVATLLAAPAAPAKPADYAFDPVHTQVLFSVSHLGFSNQVGRIAKVSGGFRFDEDDWSAATVDVTMDMTSLYLGDAAWEKKVMSDFFAAGEHPTARFVSKQVEAVGARHARVAGDLTLRGVTKPVTLDVTLNRIGRHSFSLQYVAGFSATATIKRSQFGMTRLLPAVGDDVTIRLEVEGLRKKRGDERDPDDKE